MVPPHGPPPVRPRSARTDKAPPPYAIEGVDRALHLAAILQLEGSITVTEAARRLGVAPSTAHRLLAMLVHRDFAVRGDKAYEVGPVLAPGSPATFGTGKLRALALPHLEALSGQFAETVHAALRAGTTVRFLAGVESRLGVRVGARTGMSFPAHRTSLGLVLLADLTDAEVEALYAGASGPDAPHLSLLLPTLARVRRTGYALNRNLSERGVVAVGVPVRDAAGEAALALSVAMPTARYAPAMLRPLVVALQRAARGLEADLLHHGPGSGHASASGAPADE